MKNALLNIAVSALALSASIASATTLSTTLHVDNGYIAYIATSDNTQGTQFSNGDNWGYGYPSQTTLAAGQDYYLHIFAWDEGGIAGLLGQFTLSGTDHQFANGTHTLLSNTTDWMGNNAGFNGAYGALTSLGNNGVGPWGTQGDVSGAATWFWAGDAYDNNAAWFTTKISAVAPATSNVPEPTSIALLALGAAGLVAGRRRK